MKLAIVGSGIAGLSAAHRLNPHAEVTLFEAGDYFGGHTHTVDLTLNSPNGPITHGVDTGFLVFNKNTYPNLIELFDSLNVPTVKADMSFSVQAPLSQRSRSLVWSGRDLNGVFAQRGNLFSLPFYIMLADVIRFNKLATRLAGNQQGPALMQPLSSFLDQHRFSTSFREGYFLPMISCIWSCPIDQMLQFPIASLIRFCHNHGLLQIRYRPQWWTVAGGARQYVDVIINKLTRKRLNSPIQRIERSENGVVLYVNGQHEHFDKVILACHSDQALSLLAQPSQAEASCLRAIRYQSNMAVLHTDASVMPSKKRAWAAWNFERLNADVADISSRVCLHYWINVLQPLPFSQEVFVSLNPLRDIDDSHIYSRFQYSHPIFDLPAVAAQKEIPSLQGRNNTYFCGAWTGYGFHEDGLKSGLNVATLLQESYPILNNFQS